MHPDTERHVCERLTTWGYLQSKDAGQDELEDAILRYQQCYSIPLQRRCQAIHGRGLYQDGDLGPATLAEINARTCDAKADPPEFLLVKSEEARWPDACVKEITTSWDFSKLPGLSEEETKAEWDSLSQYEELFEMLIPRQPDEYPNTRIYASLRSLPGSTLAWSNLANNSCSYRAQQAYDSTISWSRKLARGTIRHEVGHALGMRHTPSDPQSVMYPSMRGQTELNETDIRQMLRLGYKRRSSPPPEPPKPEPPKDKVTADVYVDGTKYHLVQEGDGGGGDGGGGWWPDL